MARARLHFEDLRAASARCDRKEREKIRGSCGPGCLPAVAGPQRK